MWVEELHDPSLLWLCLVSEWPSGRRRAAAPPILILALVFLHFYIFRNQLFNSLCEKNVFNCFSESSHVRIL